MHHFIYPSKDTYITNQTDLDDKNFGIDEILQIGTSNRPQRVLSPTRIYVYTNTIFSGQSVTYFTGIFTGSFGGTVEFASGSISGSNLDFSASYFSGSIDGVPQTLSASVVSGSLVDGYITGSVIAPYVTGIFTGHLTGSVVCLTGTGSGADLRNEPIWITEDVKFIDRALLKFDISAVSASISLGTIINPRFHLNVKVCNEYNMPIAYTIYALPVSQSWNMGDGYWSDGGSDEGVSWHYRDFNLANSWYNVALSSAHPAIDFISDPTEATRSFGYGGGTWYTHSYASQSFRYQSSDIHMDVTNLVMEWISGSTPNEGFLLISSDELVSTGSGFILKYFSRDTNTIYSPFLDVAWNDAYFTTGSFSTSSVTITTINSGISASVQSGSTMTMEGGVSGSGSTMTIAGGVSGSFSGSALLSFATNYITASDQVFNYVAGVSAEDNAVWYANNGYHYDSWYSAWQLDPIRGGFLPNTDIQITPTPILGSPPIFNFTGSFTGSFHNSASVNGTISGSGQFSASYFSGSVNGTDQEVNNSVVSGSVDGIISGSVTTVDQLGIYTGELTSSMVYLTGTGSGYYQDATFQSFGGFTNGMGLSGNILGLPIFGQVWGLVTISKSLVTGPCGKSFSAFFAKALFTTGMFSGSAFTAYYIDHKFENALLTGSWNEVAWVGVQVNIVLPSAIDPYAYAYINGTYVWGNAIGLYTISGSNGSPDTASAGANSASFVGQFVDGPLLGADFNLQLSGSVFTGSYAYTSSVELTSIVMNGLNISNPFTLTLQNVSPEYRVGDIVRMNVFGRKKFPLKYFGKSTQQEQYLVPEYLPTSSFYALKDDQTEEIVLNFDSYTQISCDYPSGNFFVLDTTGLPQERYYRVLIRVQDEGETYTIDTGKTFKIVRGGVQYPASASQG